MDVICRQPEENINWRTSAAFLAVHLTPLLVFFTGIDAKSVVMFMVLYWTRAFFITAGYHRYFSHRAYRTNRVFQFVLAFGGASAAQKGPLWWAAHHRDHHRYTDTARDPHTPLKGFWFSHVGWIMSDAYSESQHDKITDFAKYPELRFLDRYDFIAPWSVAIAAFLVGGARGLVVGFFCSTVLLWHTTFMVNSYAHIWGRRRYGTTDTSQNSFLVAFLTLGEGWHNNHHHYPACARQGFRWWEYDMSYYVLKAMSFVGLVRDLKEPPAKVREHRRIRLGALDVGSIRLHLNRAAMQLEKVRDKLPPEEVEQLSAGLADVSKRAAAAARKATNPVRTGGAAG